MPTLDGKTYEMQYLTDEEVAVINAMRRGAEANVYFFNSTLEAAEQNEAELDNALTRTNKRTLQGVLGPFDSYDLKMGKHTIFHFIEWPEGQ